MKPVSGAKFYVTNISLMASHFFCSTIEHPHAKIEGKNSVKNLSILFITLTPLSPKGICPVFAITPPEVKKRRHSFLDIFKISNIGNSAQNPPPEHKFWY